MIQKNSELTHESHLFFLLAPFLKIISFGCASLDCFMQAFSSCSEQFYSSLWFAVFFTAVASLLWSIGSETDFSSCRIWAQ